MNLVENTSKYKKLIKYTYFVVLIIAICWAEWHYQTINNLIVSNSSQVTNNDINELKLWSYRAKCLKELGFITIFINYLSMRKRPGSKFTTMVVNYLSIRKGRNKGENSTVPPETR